MNCQKSSLLAALLFLLYTAGEARNRHGPCHAQQTGLLGAYVPQCTATGYFKVVQRHGSTGYSWCVDPETGLKADGTDVAPGAGEPTCGKCFLELEEYFTGPFLSIGRNKPLCNDDGRYMPLQINNGEDTWCVDRDTGVKIPGTEVSRDSPQGEADCGPVRKRRSNEPHGICGYELDPSSAGKLPKSMPHDHSPLCANHGYYQLLQIHRVDGHSWCVNPQTGETVDGSYAWPQYNQGTADCSVYGCINKLAEALEKNNIGGWIPTCDSSGNYEPFQRNAGTGYTWCVDRKSGNAIDGTQVGPGPRVAICPTLGVCGHELDPANADKLPKTMPPDHDSPYCANNGFYQPLQYHRRRDYTWCVNPQTGEAVEGSRREHDQGRAQCSNYGCITRLAEVLEKNNYGGWIPSCDSKGNYEPFQRNAGTGYSWCVDTQSGNAIDGSQVGPGAGEAKCSTRKRRSGEPHGTCGYELDPSSAGKLPKTMPLDHSPFCANRGYYNLLQIHRVDGHSWCVNPRTGETVDGSSRPRIADCSVYGCINKLAEALQKNNYGGWIPACDSKGNYEPFQRNAGTGYSWCVDAQSGNAIDGSQVGPTAGQATCASPDKRSPCEIEAAKGPIPHENFGYYVLKCDATNGKYAPVQTTADGFRYCVDTESGVKYPNSPVYGPNNDSKLPCE